MPINQPADGSTNWGPEVRAAIAAVNTLEGVTAANLPETIRDTIGSTVVGTGLVTVTPNDVADTVTVATTATANSSDATLLNRANHTGNQTFATLSDGTEAVQDVVGAMVVAGTNVSTTYNDAAGTLTISASGGGGSGGGIPVINVKTDHGATGNGSTDDTAAIQAALNAVPFGGGIVYLPVGRYKISAMLTLSVQGTQLIGAGAGSTNQGTASRNISLSRLEASGTLSGNPMLRVQLPDPNGTSEPVFGAVMRDIALDGMGTATGVGIHWRSYQSHISGVHVYRFGSHGFHFQGYSGWALYDSIFTNLEAAYNLGAGLYLDSGAADMHITQSVIYNNGINFQYHGGSSLQVDDCHFYSPTGTNNMLFDGGGTRSKFTNCKIEGANNAHIINIDSTNLAQEDIQFVGCNIHENGDFTVANSFDNVIVQGNPSNGIHKLMFVGCSFGSYGTGQLPRYAINFTNSVATSPMVVGCHFGAAGDFASGIINDSSSGSSPAFIRGNAGTAFKTLTNGNATITSAATSIAVTHGITGVTPLTRHVRVVPTNNLGSATKWWISGMGSTTFTINVDVAPGASTATFSWTVDV